MVLPDGRVAVHSALHEEGDRLPKETFLYEIADRHEALRVAESMVDDALEYLDSMGVLMDDNDSAGHFLSRLHAELRNRLH
jgi:hypothetical protein